MDLRLTVNKVGTDMAGFIGRKVIFYLMTH